MDSMPNLTNMTTWSEGQQMLLDNPRFVEDPDLQSTLISTMKATVSRISIQHYIV